MWRALTQEAAGVPHPLIHLFVRCTRASKSCVALVPARAFATHCQRWWPYQDIRTYQTRSRWYVPSYPHTNISASYVVVSLTPEARTSSGTKTRVKDRSPYVDKNSDPCPAHGREDLYTGWLTNYLAPKFSNPPLTLPHHSRKQTAVCSHRRCRGASSTAHL